MAEVEYDAKCVGVDYVCDSCGEGMMRSDGSAYCTHPLTYVHECTTCGYRKDFKVQYPFAKLNILNKAPKTNQRSSDT